jgi:hypothetical protein
MGVVKEVVAALERSPVSSKDLNDLKSTRLGKFINQVRRAIPDKSLAKRMKTLVIQWRSLAQQSPTTPNGVPSRTTPPPLSTLVTPSPAPLGTTHATSPAILTTNTPPAPPQSTAPLLTSSQTLPLPPPARPSSANPAMNRKRALHRLSKFPPQHPPQKSSLSTSSSSSSSSVPTHQTTPSPTPPPTSSQSPSTTSKSPSLHSYPHPPTGKLPSKLTSKPVHIVETSPASEEQTTAPASLQVRFPLHSVTKSLVVRIPLEHVSVSRPPVVTSDEPTLRTPNEISSREGRPVPIPTADSQLVAHANGVHVDVTESAGSIAETGRTTISPPPSSLALGPTDTDRLVTEPVSLIVSIDRGLLQRQADFLNSTVSQLDTPTTDAATDKPSVRTDLNNDDGSTPVKQTQSVALSARGDFGTDSVWQRWTDPIINEDSFAVNVLPYVYIDGLEESEDESS